MVANESENVKIIIIFKKRLDHGETEGGGVEIWSVVPLDLLFFPLVMVNKIVLNQSLVCDIRPINLSLEVTRQFRNKKTVSLHMTSAKET